MLILGLTGSIGMGKSTAADQFRARGIQVFDSDLEVHDLYEGKAVPLVEAAFPGTVVSGRVDRALLSEALAGRPEKFEKLEAIIHPLVLQGQRNFLQREFARGSELAVVEIPLLFETGGEERVDRVVVVSAPLAKQRERVLTRPGMSEEKLNHILARQLPDGEKRARAGYVVDTGGSIAQTHGEIDKIIDSLSGVRGDAFETCWQQSGH